MEEDQEIENEEENLENIISVCWDCRKIAAVTYNLSTLELNVSSCC